MTDETNKVKNFINLLQYNEEYSKVLTLKNLLGVIILKNKLFRENFENKIPKETTIEKVEFFEFLHKSIICFPNQHNLNFNIFNYELEGLKQINLNYNANINDLLSQSMLEVLETNSIPEIFKYCQLIGIQMEALNEDRAAVFKNSNRLLNSSHFELLRLLIGDDIFSYIIKFCSLFLFDEKLQNYIQILGFSIKEKLMKLFNIHHTTKFVSSINLNNFSFKSSSGNSNSNNSNGYNITNQNTIISNNSINNGNSINMDRWNFLGTNINNAIEENTTAYFQSKKVYIPMQNFNIERTKIFYCPNFNRKLGFFKSAIISKNNKGKENNNSNNNKSIDFPNKSRELGHNYIINEKNAKESKQTNSNNFNCIKNMSLYVNSMYTRIFLNYSNLISNEIEYKIKAFLETLNKKISKYEYHKRLFKICPTRKDWKQIKNLLHENINIVKNIAGLTNNKDNKAGDSESQTQEEKQSMEIISKHFCELLASTIEYKNIFEFIQDFLNFCLPKEFIGNDNYQVLLEKVKVFISLNRFETLNRINLFDAKEFSFKKMRWLEFSKMSKTTYVEIGTNLKNFIMKNIIFWLFDFLIVQLIRSHFYVTEKQGDHYKTFYYHKKDWDLIMKINEIKFRDQFAQIPKENAISILNQKDLTFGKLRLVPKPSTCRPIISYKKRTLRTKSLLKNLLFDTQKVFKHLSSVMQNTRDNCVVFEYKAIIQKLRKFRHELNERVKTFVKENYNKENEPDQMHAKCENISARNFNTPLIQAIKKMNELYYMNRETKELQKLVENLNKKNNNINNDSCFNYNLVLSEKIDPDCFMNKESNLNFMNLEDLNTSNNGPRTNKNKDLFVFSNENDLVINFSTLDIEGCYDNIDIEKMLKILNKDELISEEFASNVLYVILPKPHMLNKRFKDNVSFKDCFEIKKLFFVTDNSEYLHFLDYLKGRSDLNYSYCVLYQDYNNMTYLRKRDLLPRISNIITNNIIKFNKKFFKQTRGIPQGLSISSFLCNLYFYNIEKELCRKYYRENPFSTKLLLRFMDDYLCVSTAKYEVQRFVKDAQGLSCENKFNFNMKKSRNNLDENKKSNYNGEKLEITKNSIINGEAKNILPGGNGNNAAEIKIPNDKGPCVALLSDKRNKLNWNGINFYMQKEFNFDMLIDSKENYDIKQYGTLININIPPLNNKNDFNWLYKKICSIFLTGHPWIYFISEINNLNVLLANYKDFVQVITFKLIIFTNILSGTYLKPSQNQFIDILDTCLKKLYFYFNNKIIKAENKLFFLKDFEIFAQMFYINMFEIYEHFETGKLNEIVIKKSPYLFKCLRRKVLRLNKLRILQHLDNFNTQK